jgi:hypothetical protein
MGRQVRIALAALAGASVVTAGAVVFSGASAAVGPSPAPVVQAAEATCVTDGNGFCTVTHSLGKVPAAILVSPNTPAAFNAFTLNTVQGSYTATTFQVRAMFTQTTPKTFGQIWFTYAAYGAATTPTFPTTLTSAPPTTPKTTATMPPPTTTSSEPPPPTTSGSGGS